MVEILAVLVIVGVVLYLVNTYVPMVKPIKIVINTLVVLFLCVWILQLFGITNFRMPNPK